MEYLPSMFKEDEEPEMIEAKRERLLHNAHRLHEVIKLEADDLGEPRGPVQAAFKAWYNGREQALERVQVAAALCQQLPGHWAEQLQHQLNNSEAFLILLEQRLDDLAWDQWPDSLQP